MEHENLFQVLISDEKGLIFIISEKVGEPQAPFLLYDGRNHATFYRQPQQVILLDYLNPEIHQLLYQTEWILMMEMDDTMNEVIKDYKVKVRHVKVNPLTGGLK